MSKNKLVFALAFFLGTLGAAHAASDLAQAYNIIASKKFVDLTHSFGPTTPVWSGFGQAKFTPAYDPKTHRTYTIKHDGFHTTYYNMVGQYGTHVDPPAHFAEGGKTMDQIPLKQMILPLIVVDDTPFLKTDPNHAFSVNRPQSLGEGARQSARRLVRRAPHRHVQGLGFKPEALQAPSIPGLGVRDDQVPLFAAWSHRHRP